MFKPPFIISNRDGTELWPRSTQIPTTTKIHVVYPEGMTPLARNIVDGVTTTRLNDATGRLKQIFLQQRQMSDLGIVPFVSVRTQVSKGIVANYVRNSTLETINVVVNASAVLDDLGLQLLNVSPMRDCFIWIVYDWSSGRDLDTLTRISTPGPSRYVGWWNPAGFSAPFVNNQYRGKEVIGWVSGDNVTTSGPEIVYVDPSRLFEDGYPEVVIDLNANWFAESGSSTYVTIQCYRNPDRVPTERVSDIGYWDSPNTLRRKTENLGLVLFEEFTFSTAVSVLSNGTPVQRLGQLTLTAPPGGTALADMNGILLPGQEALIVPRAELKRQSSVINV